MEKQIAPFVPLGLEQVQQVCQRWPKASCGD
jgi:hypothetical protein